MDANWNCPSGEDRTPFPTADADEWLKNEHGIEFMGDKRRDDEAAIISIGTLRKIARAALASMTGNRYEFTDFGLSVCNGDFTAKPADKDEEIAALKAGISGLQMQLEKCREDADARVQQAQGQCSWTYDADPDCSAWHTTCGNMHVINDGTPEENRMRYCCYCGGKLASHHGGGGEGDGSK